MRNEKNKNVITGSENCNVNSDSLCAEEKDGIRLHYQRNYYNVRFEHIEYIRAYSGEAEFKVDNHIMRKKVSLNDIEKHLGGNGFFRVNKSYIVNLLQVTDYKDGIVFIGDIEIPLARRKKKEFEKAYMNHKLKDYIVL